MNSLSRLNNERIGARRGRHRGNSEILLLLTLKIAREKCPRALRSHVARPHSAIRALKASDLTPAERAQGRLRHPLRVRLHERNRLRGSQAAGGIILFWHKGSPTRTGAFRREVEKGLIGRQRAEAAFSAYGGRAEGCARVMRRMALWSDVTPGVRGFARIP